MLGVGQLLGLIDRLYEGALDDEAWQDALHGLIRAFGAMSAGLVIHDMRTRRLQSGLFLDTDVCYQRAYADVMVRPDIAPLFARLAQSISAAVVTDGMMGITSGPFYDEWLRPQGIRYAIVAKVTADGPAPGILAMGRARQAGDFGDDEVAALRILQPHLLRALQVRLRLEAAAAAAVLMGEAVDRVAPGVLLVDATAGVRHANSAAQALLRSRDGLAVTAGRLACDHPDDSRALHRLIGDSAIGALREPPGIFAVRRRSGRRPLAVLVTPLRDRPRLALEAPAVAMLLIGDAEHAATICADDLRRLYGLTPAEARVAAAVLDANGLADVAGRLGVSLSTVRIHLQRVFDKTGTHRQADLARLMMAHRIPGAPEEGTVESAAGR